MKRLLVLGAGGHAKVVAEAAIACGFARVAFASDDPLAHGRRVLGHPIVGAIADSVARGEFDAVVVAIGENATRLRLQDRFEAEGAPFARIVHPRAVVSPSASIGSGTVVFANVVVNAEARIGRACILNTACVIEHDCVLGDGVHISPGAALAGAAGAGQRAWVGLGACVRQGVRVGAGSIIGAGAVLLADSGDGETWAGVPARRLGSPGAARNPNPPPTPTAR